MAPESYIVIFAVAMVAVVAVTCMPYLFSSGSLLISEGEKSTLVPVLLAITFALFVGGRPVSSVFGDTVSYAREYSNLTALTFNADWRLEWVWAAYMQTCHRLGLSMTTFFTITDLLYVISAVWAVKKLIPDNLMLAMLFVFGSLMFFSYSVNGLRNGLACHLVLLGIAFVLEGRWLVALAIMAGAFGIHRSVVLPIAAVLAAVSVLRSVRAAIVIWIASIGVSLLMGNRLLAMFAALGFDDRMVTYATATFSDYAKQGFRWDFLLYSAMPVLMAWYVCVYKHISDSWYNALCVTYCLCNAFWILVIQATFSNRFAYLSWFIYPVVIAYPLIMLPLRDDQDRWVGRILCAYLAFTLMMFYIWGY